MVPASNGSQSGARQVRGALREAERAARSARIQPQAFNDRIGRIKVLYSVVSLSMLYA